MARIRTLRDHIYDHISAKIRGGTLKPNDKIDERALCEQLGVSRTPVRETLIELANEGYMVRTPRHGFRVKPISRREVKEIYDIFGCLEALAAEKAAPHLSQSDFVTMEKLIKQMDIAINTQEQSKYYRLQKEFHEVFIKKSRSETLYRILTSLKERFLRQAYTHYESEQTIQPALNQYNEEHKAILNMFRTMAIEELKKYLKDIHWVITDAHLESD